jgi:hypothetical protein
MDSMIDQQQIQILGNTTDGFWLTCHRSQVEILRNLWRQHDFPLFQVVSDAVTINGEEDVQVTIRLGAGDPVDQIRQVLDQIDGFGIDAP